MDDERGFPERLKEAQKRVRVDNRALAEAVGVHAVTVSQWRSGKQQPEGETLRKVAVALGVTPAWLRYGSERDVTPPLALHERLDNALDGARREDADLPQQLELMALDFEREAVKAGADRAFMRYARARMRDPHLLAMFVGGYDEKPMNAEEQRVEFETVIEELRRLLRRRLDRFRTESRR